MKTPKAPMSTQVMKLTSKWSQAARRDCQWPLRRARRRGTALIIAEKTEGFRYNSRRLMESPEAKGETQSDASETEEVEDAEVHEAESLFEQELPAEEFDVPLSVQPGEQADDSHDTSLVPYDPLQRYLAEVRKYPFLSKEEELQLFHDYRTTGNREAAVKLILSNLRVSVAIAAEYLHFGADYMDLIQEGNVGLMQAIRKFDPTKGVRFHSYAAWWVRAYVLRYLLNTHRLVKIGTTQDQRKLFYNLNKEKRKLEREGFVPDTKLLADRLHVRERDVVEMAQRLGSWDISLDAPIGPDQEGTLMEILPAQGTPADETLADEELRSEEHTSELQSRLHLVCRLLLEKKKKNKQKKAHSDCCVTWSGRCIGCSRTGAL